MRPWAGQDGNDRAFTGSSRVGVPRRPSSSRTSRPIPSASRQIHTVCADTGGALVGQDGGGLGHRPVLGPQRQHPIPDPAGLARPFRPGLGVGATPSDPPAAGWPADARSRWSSRTGRPLPPPTLGRRGTPANAAGIGHAAHPLGLGIGAEVVVVDADDWRTKHAGVEGGGSCRRPHPGTRLRPPDGERGVSEFDRLRRAEYQAPACELCHIHRSTATFWLTP
jgi:hypothetical protein